MKRIILRRLVTDGASGARNVYWILFYEGNISQPLVILSDMDIMSLLEQIRSEDERE